MKKTLVMLAVLTSLLAFSLEIIQDLEVGEELARIEGKKLILAFELKTCPHCRRMNTVTFQDKEVEKLIRANFVLVVQFYSEDTRALFAKFKVSSVPILWFFKYNDKEKKWTPLNYLPGYVDPDMFVLVLRYVAQELKESFRDYIKKKDDFIGNKMLIEVSKEEADFVLKHDPYALKIERYGDFKTPFHVYVTTNEELAQKLSKEAYRVLLVR